MNYVTGTFTNADSTAYALGRVDSCNVVFNSDCTLRADSNAVTVAKAGKLTCLVTLVMQVYETTALNALVLKLTAGSITRT